MESVKYYIRGTVTGSKVYETYTEELSSSELTYYEDEVQSFIAYETTELAQYIDDRYSCIQGVVTSIYPGIKVVSDEMLSITEITANAELNEEQKKAVLDYLSGQFSDGWGEGVEQRAFKEDVETEEEYNEEYDEYEEYDVNVEYYIHFWQPKNFKLEFIPGGPISEDEEVIEILPKPRCKLIGEDGNIFNLLGIAGRTLVRAGMREQQEEMLMKVHNEAKSYSEALNIIMEYVEVE